MPNSYKMFSFITKDHYFNNLYWLYLFLNEFLLPALREITTNWFFDCQGPIQSKTRWNEEHPFLLPLAMQTYLYIHTVMGGDDAIIQTFFMQDKLHHIFQIQFINKIHKFLYGRQTQCVFFHYTYYCHLD